MHSDLTETHKYLRKAHPKPITDIPLETAGVRTFSDSPYSRDLQFSDFEADLQVIKVMLGVAEQYEYLPSAAENLRSDFQAAPRKETNLALGPGVFYPGLQFMCLPARGATLPHYGHWSIREDSDHDPFTY